MVQLDNLVAKASTIEDMQKAADFCHTQILSKMEEMRLTVNAAEALIPDSILPYPTYGQLLFSL